MFRLIILAVIIVICYFIVKEVLAIRERNKLTEEIQEAHEELLETEIISSVMDVKEEVAHKKRVLEQRDKKLNS